MIYKYGTLNIKKESDLNTLIETEVEKKIFIFNIVHSTTESEIGMRGVEIVAVFSRDIKVGETIRVDLHKRGEVEKVFLSVVDKQGDHLYVVREEDYDDGVFICEIITSSNTSAAWSHIGRIFLRPKVSEPLSFTLA